MAKIQGQLEDAQLENLGSDPTPGKAGRISWDTATLQAKVDDATAIRALLRNDLKAIIGNSGTASQNIRFHRGAAGVLQIPPGDDATAEGTLATTVQQFSSRHENYSTAGRPANGNIGRTIWNIDTLRLEVDNGTSWDPVGSGSSFGINYILNSTADEVVTGWAAYADAAGSVPVDGTGGSPTTTITRSTSSPLRGAGSFLITKDAANRQGEGASYAFTIDAADKNKILSIGFDFEVASGTFVTGDSSDLRVFIYDVTGTTLITPNVFTIQGSPGKFQATFPATSSTSYRLIIHVATVSALAYTFKFDNVTVGPQTPAVYGPAMTDWSLALSSGFTPNGFGTPPAKSIYTRRIGDSLHVRGYFTIDVASAVTTASISLPTGYVIDSTKFTNTTNLQVVGRSNLAEQGTNQVYATTFGQIIVYDGSDTAKVYIAVRTDASNDYFRKDVGLSVGNDTDNIVFDFIVPIVGWSTNVATSASSQFIASSLAANGTRVTTTPAELGQYRSRYKSGATSNTFSDVAPTTAPTAADGFRIHAIDYAAAQTSGQISLYDVFVGKNKFVTVRFFASAARTGQVYTDYRIASSTVSYGALWFYDPTTGVVTINAGTNELATNTTRNLGAIDAGTAVTNGYFEVYVSENALSVQQELSTEYALLSGGNGRGSVNTAVRNYTTAVSSSWATAANSGTSGASITFSKSGLYSITCADVNTTASAIYVAPKINLTTAPTDTAYSPTAQLFRLDVGNTRLNGNSVVVYIQAGSVLRTCCDVDTNYGTVNYAQLLVTKVG